MSKISVDKSLTKKSPNNGGVKKFKEEIVYKYEFLTTVSSNVSTDDVPLPCHNPDLLILHDENFWYEFFLITPKVRVLESELLKLNHDQLSILRLRLQRLFERCITFISVSYDHNDVMEEDEDAEEDVEFRHRQSQIRLIYALQTLAAFFKAMFKKRDPDLIHLFMGFDNVESRMKALTSQINRLLAVTEYDEYSKLCRDLCLKSLLIIATGTDNVSQNVILEYFMVDSGGLFRVLVDLLKTDESRRHSENAVLLLTILVQYRKYESENPYIVQLSMLDQEVALTVYAHVITSSLQAALGSNEQSGADNSTGWLTSFTSMVGSMFVSEDNEKLNKLCKHKPQTPVLLALYEACHLNRNFISTLTRYSNDYKEDERGGGRGGGTGTTTMTKTTTSTTTTTTTSSSSSSSSTSTKINSVNGTPTTPRNLLASFLEYCSIIMQDIKAELSYNIVKLNFIVLLCVSEDQYANVLMHDPNLVFRVKLHFAPMHHRITHDSERSGDGRIELKPLSCSILDLAVEFITSHLTKKKFPADLYLQSLSIIHRLLSYQKQSKTRLRYPWKELWKALMDLLNVIPSVESVRLKDDEVDVYAVAIKVITIFNLFITYGDTFLACPSTYDELYYELVRRDDIFVKLHYHATAGAGKNVMKNNATAAKLTGALVNIRAITAHFKPKIKAWLEANELSTPTPEQTLDVVKSNYESLTLKLQEGLDHYERYSESPKYSSFFKVLVQSVVKDTRQQIILEDLKRQDVLCITASASSSSSSSSSSTSRI